MGCCTGITNNTLLGMSKAMTEARREGNRRRQARWRKKNAWLGEQRRLATYGKSDAHKRAGMTNNDMVEEIWVEDPDSGERIKVRVDGRTKIGRALLLLWRQVGNMPVLDVPSGRDERPGIEVEGF